MPDEKTVKHAAGAYTGGRQLRRGGGEVEPGSLVSWGYAKETRSPMAVQFRNAVPRGGWEVRGRDHPGAQSPVAVARAGGGGGGGRGGRGGRAGGGGA